MSMIPMKSRRFSPFPPTAGIPPILQTEKRTSALLVDPHHSATLNPASHVSSWSSVSLQVELPCIDSITVEYRDL